MSSNGSRTGCKALKHTSSSPPESTSPRVSKIGGNRTSVACVHCRKRKSRCVPTSKDRSSGCKNCGKRGLSCTFVAVEKHSSHKEESRRQQKLQRRREFAEEDGQAPPTLSHVHNPIETQPEASLDDLSHMDDTGVPGLRYDQYQELLSGYPSPNTPCENGDMNWPPNYMHPTNSWWFNEMTSRGLHPTQLSPIVDPSLYRGLKDPNYSDPLLHFSPEMTNLEFSPPPRYL